MLHKLIVPAALALVALSVSNVSAQVSDDQLFRVTVGPSVTITAPTTDPVITHDETDNDQDFAAQNWTITCNNATGANVSFETDQAFTHTSDGSYKRDASLNLTKVSGDAWTVTTSDATTDYDGPTGEVVSVGAASTTAGAASFNLNVSFVEETFTDLAAGDYEMTVTGTLTPNS